MLARRVDWIGIKAYRLGGVACNLAADDAFQDV